MQAIMTVGKSCQISIGKARAGTAFIVEELPGGDIMLKRFVVVPMNERWLHEPAMRDKLTRAEEWVRQNPPRKSNLDEFD